MTFKSFRAAVWIAMTTVSLGIALPQQASACSRILWNDNDLAVVVSRTSALVYKIKKHFGTFSLDEVVGVTGDATKLADQGAANPTFIGKPVSASCFGGAGNSIASLSNYADIPADWK